MPPLFLIAAAAAALQPGSATSPPAPVTIPDQPALTEQIRAADKALFDLFFTGPCEPERLRSMLTPDIEFYHDKGGFNVRSDKDFVAIFEKNCHDRQDPKAWRSRRELVADSLQVDPIPGYGAVEAGEHLFFEKEGAQGIEKLAGRARFAQLWVLGADGAWRISRVFSYGHRPAQ
ncbi:MAG TPA: nuclear transport factor 2 family protein [Allosphingosinicella sp.]|jgi:hypothetical protein